MQTPDKTTAVNDPSDGSIPQRLVDQGNCGTRPAGRAAGDSWQPGSSADHAAVATSEEIDAWMTAAQANSDQDAFALVVEHTHHLIRATMLRETADPDLADELAQEALTRAWIKREQYRPGTSPRAWMMSIARSQLMEHHRRADRDRRHMRELVRQELLRHAPHDNGRENQTRLVALKACLEEVAPEHRQLLDLVHQQGMTSDDAAELLGIKAPACRQRLSRLQRALRTCAEKRLEIA